MCACHLAADAAEGLASSLSDRLLPVREPARNFRCVCCRRLRHRRAAAGSVDVPPTSARHARLAGADRTTARSSLTSSARWGWPHPVGRQRGEQHFGIHLQTLCGILQGRGILHHGREHHLLVSAQGIGRKTQGVAVLRDGSEHDAPVAPEFLGGILQGLAVSLHRREDVEPVRYAAVLEEPRRAAGHPGRDATHVTVVRRRPAGRRRNLPHRVRAAVVLDPGGCRALQEGFHLLRIVAAVGSEEAIRLPHPEHRPVQPRQEARDRQPRGARLRAQRKAGLPCESAASLPGGAEGGGKDLHKMPLTQHDFQLFSVALGANHQLAAIDLQQYEGVVEQQGLDRKIPEPLPALPICRQDAVSV
mmetsp:Transcript_148759/g.477768  ORF Transcript_148759/g.477768 Transcript_148759/m.477768 type:complete len:361 (+) Transcript_148759:862-1944(+)